MRRSASSGLLERGVPTARRLPRRAAARRRRPAREPRRAAEPEIGWHPVELTEARPPTIRVLGGAAAVASRPSSGTATTYVPAAGRGRAWPRSPVSTQAFRLGERAWGIQFHAEITEPQIESWIGRGAGRAAAHARRRDRSQDLGEWQSLGRRLCGDFLGLAEDVRRRRLALLGGQLRVARPLVPRAGVVAGAGTRPRGAPRVADAEREPEWQ